MFTKSSSSTISIPYDYRNDTFFQHGRNYDVTDNKTDVTSNSANISCLIPMLMMDREELRREDVRLTTFEKFPNKYLTKNDLALIGLYYTGEGDKVKCFFCGVEIGHWENDDVPLTEHLKYSPHCPLLRRRDTDNIPINTEKLDQILPPISYDVCGRNDVLIRPNSYPEGTITNCYPEYPEYAVESARLRSFAEWPRHMKQTPEGLAEAGFFYTGVGDRVKCFSCGGGLKDWDVCDIPWEQHALWLNKCRYLRLIKGQKYIDSIVNGERAKESSEEGASREVQEATPKPEVPVAAEMPWNGEIPAQDSLATVKQMHKDACKETVANQLAVENVATVVGGKTEAERSSISDEKLCKICYACEFNTAFLPCGHVVACAKCASSVTKCPLCRKPFIDVMRVYFS